MNKGPESEACRMQDSLDVKMLLAYGILRYIRLGVLFVLTFLVDLS